MPHAPPAPAASAAVLPMIVTRAGLALMGLADVLMLARHDAGDLAALGLVEGTFGRLLDIGVAAVLSALPVAGAAYAAGGSGALAPVWRRSVITALAAGALLAIPALLAGPLLAMLTRDRGLAEAAAALVPVCAAGALAGLVAMACALALEAMGRAGDVARAVIAANLGNLVLNAVLIGGAGPIPPLGAAGSVLGTALVRGALMLALLGVLRARLRGTAPAPRDNASASPQWRACAAAVAIAASLHLFGLGLTTIAGWQGSAALALYTAGWAINLPALIVVSGYGDALTLQASRDRALSPARLLGRPLLLVAGLGGALLLASPLIAAGYGLADPLAGQLAGLLPLTLLVLIADAAALLVMSVLRGRQMFVGPAVAQIATMGLAVGGAWWLAAGAAPPQAVRGMVLAILATSVLKLAAVGALALFLPRDAETARRPSAGTLTA